MKAIDTYWICTAEHGLNASTFTARIAASTGADCGAAMSSAVGALSGPLHGGAPAYVIPMIDEVAEMGDPEQWVARPPRPRRPDHGLRSPRLPGGGSRAPASSSTTAEELGVAAASRPPKALEEAALAELEPAPSRARAGDERRVLARPSCSTSPDIPPKLAPAMFACSRVAGWSAHILEQKRVGRLFRPAARYVGPDAARSTPSEPLVMNARRGGGRG